MKHDWTFTSKRIAQALIEDGKEEKRADDIGFHMTDWLDDLERLHELFNEIDKRNNDEIAKLIYQFLAHAPNHLVAAYKLVGYGPIEDIFNLGIFEEDKD